MRLLLDTHVLLWASQGSRRLGRKAATLVVRPESEIWVSAATVWEIANKAALARLRLHQPAEKWLPAEMKANDYRPLAITIDHALAAATLPRHHEDPFDRMLIAQAQLEDLKVLTADQNFEAYDVGVIDASV